METCRQRRIVVPSPPALERLCAKLRHQARREVYRRLTDGLTAEQRRRLDALTQRREETNQNWLTWLRQMPEAAKPGAMLGLTERLEHVRTIGIEPGRGRLVHQARLALLAREAGRTTVQHVAGYERQRRHATLAAISLDLAASLTDQAIDLFDRLIGAMFAKMQARIMSAMVWTMRLGSRRSGKCRAKRSARPSRRSASDKSMMPPSDVGRPPSKSAVTLLLETRRADF